jgi:FKBP-type peptidyl-prolyl cis-trans isomerase 2
MNQNEETNVTVSNESLVETTDLVSVHYVGKFEDGSVFDSSRERGEPFSFEVGSRSVVSGFSNGVLGMRVGEKKEFVITPEFGYGFRDESLIQTIEKQYFPDDFEFIEGATIHTVDESGRTMLVKLLEDQGDDGILLDLNHPLAGTNMVFEVEVVSMLEKRPQLETVTNEELDSLAQ